jgi:hypothetical protein
VLREPLLLRAVGPKRLAPPSEAALTAWIREHLEVAVHPFDRPGAIEDLEERVLAILDPSLNLDKVPPTPHRQRLGELRGLLTSPRPAGARGSPLRKG